jgi:hypothetical protein
MAALESLLLGAILVRLAIHFVSCYARVPRRSSARVRVRWRVRVRLTWPLGELCAALLMAAPTPLGRTSVSRLFFSPAADRHRPGATISRYGAAAKQVGERVRYRE